MVDTLVNFGLGALVLALLVSVYGIIASLYGQSIKERAWIDSGRNAMMLTFPLITVAASMIIILLVQNHFEVSYVSQVTSRSMPDPKRSGTSVRLPSRLISFPPGP